MSAPRTGNRARIHVGDRTLTRALVGWREWVALPELGIDLLAAKVDTGARTSALHAVDIETQSRDGERWVSFVVPEAQRGVSRNRRRHAAPVRDVRTVRSSSGESERRFVIGTMLQIADRRFQVELTLTNRSEMEFPMLIGRSALRTGRLLIHPSRSFLQGRPRP